MYAMPFIEPQRRSAETATRNRAQATPAPGRPSAEQVPEAAPVLRRDDALGRSLSTAVLHRKDKADTAPAAPGRTQILYERDHSARAQQLHDLHPSAFSDDIDQAQPEARNIDTLVLWGHGTDNSLLMKDVATMTKLIKSWKALNPKLKTVEVITCNTRHWKDTKAARKDNSGKAFIDRLRGSLKSGLRSSTRDITIKALPPAVHGKKNTWSILLYHDSTKSWVYICGHGTEQKMFDAKNLIEFDISSTGGAVSYTGDIAEKAQKVISSNADPDRTWTMLYGYLPTLRRSLATVK